MPPDPLSEALETLRVRSMVMPTAHFTAPWGLDVPALEEMRPPTVGNGPLAGPPPGILPRGAFIAVSLGFCRVEIEGHRPFELPAGDMLFLMRGQSHRLRDSANSVCVPLRSVLPPRPRGDRSAPPPPLTLGGGGAVSRVNVGAFFTEAGFSDRFFSALPEVMHVSGKAIGAGDWLASAIRLLDFTPVPGEAGWLAVRSRLVNTLFVQAVRVFIQSLPLGSANWLRSLLDPDIGPVLAAMSQRLSVPWTVGSLADVVSMSRSAFAARFTQMVGVPPLQYLTELRMNHACQLLADPGCSIKQIAQHVGYESVAAFSNAFKRQRGLAPANWRGTNLRSDSPAPPPSTPITLDLSASGVV